MKGKKWIIGAALVLGMFAGGSGADNAKQKKPKKLERKVQIVWQQKEAKLEKELNAFEPWVKDLGVTFAYLQKELPHQIYAVYLEDKNQIIFCRPESIKRSTAHEITHYITDDKGKKGILYQQDYSGPSWKQIINAMKIAETPQLRNMRRQYMANSAAEIIKARMRLLADQIIFFDQYDLPYSNEEKVLSRQELLKYVTSRFKSSSALAPTKRWACYNELMNFIERKNEDYSNRYRSLIKNSQKYFIPQYQKDMKSIEAKLKKIHPADCHYLQSFTALALFGQLYQKQQQLQQIRNPPHLPTNNAAIDRADAQLAITYRDLFSPKEMFARYTTALMQAYVGPPTYEVWPCPTSLRIRVHSKMYWKSKQMFGKNCRKYDLAEELMRDGFKWQTITKKIRYAELVEYGKMRYTFSNPFPAITLSEKIPVCKNPSIIKRIHQ